MDRKLTRINRLYMEQQIHSIIANNILIHALQAYIWLLLPSCSFIIFLVIRSYPYVEWNLLLVAFSVLVALIFLTVVLHLIWSSVYEVSRAFAMKARKVIPCRKEEFYYWKLKMRTWHPVKMKITHWWWFNLDGLIPLYNFLVKMTIDLLLL